MAVIDVLMYKAGLSKNKEENIAQSIIFTL